MDNLIHNNLIKYPVFSLFTSMDSGNASYIKFGGYDESAMRSQSKLIMMKSLSRRSFSLGLDLFMIGGEVLYNRTQYK